MAQNTPTFYAKVLYDLTIGLEKQEYDGAIQTFLEFLRKEERINKIEYILEAFVRYAKKQQGIEEMEITTARSLEKKEIDLIVHGLGKQAEVTSVVDPALVGGIKIRVGDTIMDASVRTQLRHLKDALQS